MVHRSATGFSRVSRCPGRHRPRGGTADAGARLRSPALCTVRPPVHSAARGKRPRHGDADACAGQPEARVGTATVTGRLDARQSPNRAFEAADDGQASRTQAHARRSATNLAGEAANHFASRRARHHKWHICVNRQRRSPTTSRRIVGRSRRSHSGTAATVRHERWLQRVARRAVMVGVELACGQRRAARSTWSDEGCPGVQARLVRSRFAR